MIDEYAQNGTTEIVGVTFDQDGKLSEIRLLENGAERSVKPDSPKEWLALCEKHKARLDAYTKLNDEAMAKQAVKHPMHPRYEISLPRRILISVPLVAAAIALLLHAVVTDQLVFTTAGMSIPIFLIFIILGIVVALWSSALLKSKRGVAIRAIVFGIVLFILIFGGMLISAIIANQLSK